MKKEIKKMLSFFLCVSIVVSCIGCGKTQGDIVDAGGNEAPGSYITITDEMLEERFVHTGDYDDWHLTEKTGNTMVVEYGGGEADTSWIQEFLELDQNEIILVGVVSRTTAIYDSVNIPKGEKTSVLNNYHAFDYKKYESNLFRVDAFSALFEYLNKYVSTMKANGYSEKEIVESEFFVKAFDYCINSEYGLMYNKKHEFSSLLNRVESNYRVAKRFEEYGFKVVWDGTDYEYGAYSMLADTLEKDYQRVNCIIATTPKQLKHFINSIPKDESYSFCCVPDDPVNGFRILSLKKVLETENISFVANKSGEKITSLDDYFNYIAKESSTPEKYTDGNIFCLTADSPGMDQAKYEELMKIKQQFISAGLIK